MAISTPTPTRLAYSYREAAQQLGVCERVVWQLCRDGMIKTARIGRSVRIPAEALREYLASITGQG